MGDRYCDGVVDPAWQFINNSDCSKGFDEKWCPKRFKCNADGKVSVDVLHVCDGKADCDDASDEVNCDDQNDDRLFSSDTEMIDDLTIKAAFWIMGLVVIFGNGYVIIDNIKVVKERKLNNLLFQRIIVINISIADFIMGVYLLTIAAYSVKYSGIYGIVESEWMSSLTCSVIGSLAIISSQTSCLLMVILTAFRLMNICQPINSLTASLLPWKLALFSVWMLSFCLGIFPMISVTAPYFVHSISFSSRFHQSGKLSVNMLNQFMCNYAILGNITLYIN